MAPKKLFNDGDNMKDLFPGHFKESDEHLRKVWDTSLFVFDANILLNLYRYSDTTKNEFLRILEKVKTRVWLPHRAAEEYLDNRLKVIGQQEKSYDEAIKSVTSLKSNLGNARQHPFVSSATMEKVNLVFDELCEDLNNNKSVHTARISNDEIKNSIASIFEKRVGSLFEKDKLEKLITEGEERYKQKIPPGYKDGSKSGDSEVFVDKCRKYGDLIIWSQVIDKAMESERGVVLVTDDKKEDWWEIFEGKTVGPRPELVKEFKDRAKNTFHMYQADRFLELARENLDEKVSDEVVEEIREVKRRDSIVHNRMREREDILRLTQKTSHLFQELEHRRHRMSVHEKDHHMLHQRMRELKLIRDDVRDHKEQLFREDIDHPEHDQIMEKYGVITEEYTEVKHRLEHSSMKKNKMEMELMQLEKEVFDYMNSIE
jgi:hypothetical protein